MLDQLGNVRIEADREDTVVILGTVPLFALSKTDAFALHSCPHTERAGRHFRLCRLPLRVLLSRRFIREDPALHILPLSRFRESLQLRANLCFYDDPETR